MCKQCSLITRFTQSCLLYRHTRGGPRPATVYSATWAEEQGSEHVTIKQSTRSVYSTETQRFVLQLAIHIKSEPLVVTSIV